MAAVSPLVPPFLAAVSIQLAHSRPAVSPVPSVPPRCWSIVALITAMPSPFAQASGLTREQASGGWVNVPGFRRESSREHRLTIRQTKCLPTQYRRCPCSTYASLMRFCFENTRFGAAEW
jgi:hypothetical protein